MYSHGRGIVVQEFHGFHPVAVLLSYLTKAPLVHPHPLASHLLTASPLPLTPLFCPCFFFPSQVPPGTPVVNALSKQRAMLENIMRACIGLAPENNMMMEFK